MRRSRRPSAGREQDVPAFKDMRIATSGNFDVVGIDERSLATHDMNSVASELVLKNLPLRLADVANHEPQVVHGDLALAAVRLFVDVAVAVACEVQNRLANCFGGDRAGVERNTAQEFLL